MFATLALSVYIETVKHGRLSGAKVPIDAIVLKVDLRHRGAIIRYAALETAPSGVRTVRIGDPAALREMYPGEPFTAIADTSHTPWILSKVVRKSGASPGPGRA